MRRWRLTGLRRATMSLFDSELTRLKRSDRWEAAKSYRLWLIYAMRLMRYGNSPRLETPEIHPEEEATAAEMKESLERVLNAEAEFVAAGKARAFAILKGCLVAAHGTIDYAGVAAGLGVSEGAAQVAAHRLRKRFRELYREEIAQTLPDRAELDAELRYLAGIVAQS